MPKKKKKRRKSSKSNERRKSSGSRRGSGKSLIFGPEIVESESDGIHLDEEDFDLSD